MSASAQEENLGDLVLRRTMVSWLRSAGGAVHLYVGKMPEAYVAALGADGVRTYRSARSWTRALIAEALSRRTALVFSPGQQGLILRRLELGHALVNLLLAVCVRLRGGIVAKIGRSLEGRSRVMLTLERALATLSNMYVSRDSVTAALIRHRGRSMPDAAVGVYPEFARSADPRFLAMSFRHDRPVPLSLIERAKEICQEQNLDLIFVTQVWKDAPQHQRLAEQFEARHLDWQDRNHRTQLPEVMGTYSRSKYVISNRLHALILGWNVGALPLGYSAVDDAKIWSHMGELGLESLVVYDEEIPGLATHLSTHSEQLNRVSQRAHDQAVKAVSAIEEELRHLVARD